MTDQPKKKSRSGKVYHAKKVKERKDYVKVLGWLASLLLIGYGIASGVWLGIILGLIMALALMLEQREMVTNRGLEVYYDCRVFDYTDVWSWDDIPLWWRCTSAKASPPGVTASPKPTPRPSWPWQRRRIPRSP